MVVHWVRFDTQPSLGKRRVVGFVLEISDDRRAAQSTGRGSPSNVSGDSRTAANITEILSFFPCGLEPGLGISPSILLKSKPPMTVGG